ncbi:response regulator transcription factor [Streptomyces vinaceus]|uniref:response regulator transcription factor n=1 Tax=Streptomyces vinaceus TaxID=1960 RepID=UPI0036B48064
MTLSEKWSIVTRTPDPIKTCEGSIRDTAPSRSRWRNSIDGASIGSDSEIDKICSGVSSLSPREFEVLCLVATGMTNYSIGMELGISERTAREHIARIMLKLRVASRVEIAVVATKWEFLNLMRSGQR